MNLIIVEEKDFFSKSRILLTDRRLEHLRKVLRAQVGKRCKVGLLNGKKGVGEVLEITPEKAVLEVKLTEEPPRKLPIRLLAAMQRPLTFRKVLQSACSMGVEEIVFFHSFKVEKSYWQSPILLPESVDALVRESLEQSGDTVPIPVKFYPVCSNFFSEVLPELGKNRRNFLAHPNPEKLMLQTSGAVNIMIGPEGGFTDREVESVCQCGFELFSLGERSLRTETALPALIGAVLSGGSW